MTQSKIRPSTPSGPGPFNPAAALKVVKKVHKLEFVEMSELRADITRQDWKRGHQPAALQAKPPVTDIKVWLEWFACMESLLPKQGSRNVGILDYYSKSYP